ncbi:cell wall hydrolase [Sphingomonas sp. 2R-10]|uniref:cell wall hydrolase n=1 Tax=Sphingomonas sp. 2R-10 TaxID=3045148 RepID=UPI0019D1A8C3|nr:cell wall hydrolase [Sphingomonas sp. 2R-10]MDJ0275689.1 cell wall hydrolase [Sphingomonas sp. 2R-10]
MNQSPDAAPARHGIRTGSAVVDGVLIGLSIAAAIVPAVIVQRVPPVRVDVRRDVAGPHMGGDAAVPAIPPPPVEPAEFRNLPPDEARAFNATVPFVPGPNPAARPFRFPDDADNLARATDCLAAAVLYEAGDDARGQRAVAQVVLNRARHPAFPNTVCGVVFQGSERRTGCQFTFTCDGALVRAYPEPFWERARAIAAAALSGSVYAPVGYATHYHTDWVVPYWQSSLAKIAAVDTHLFFRWSGWWGTPGAFRQAVRGEEPRVVQLTPYSSAHKLPEVLAVEQEAGMLTGQFAPASLPRASSDDPDTFLVALDSAVSPDSWPALAAATCGDRVRCKFMGWRDGAAVPARAAAASEPAALATMSFSYLRDRTQPIERLLWNCQQVPRPAVDCMRRVVAPPPPPAVEPAAAAPLAGVRRRGDPTPVPSPLPQ